MSMSDLKIYNILQKLAPIPKISINKRDFSVCI